ncbi:TPA: phage tail family protein [Staphylococcus aureus]|nr:phage tail family protein [Staphylococcus aureus]HDZ8650472.1 phage tail family protein [Staphylococcus aureus]HDZ8697872.1 phage tail family protein [Staphylococcus aureus]HDZ8768645.1 phage tail family protein [Staphylococcus aureus]
MSDRWVKIIDKDEEIIGAKAPFLFLDASVDFPSTVENTVTLNGMDGEMVGPLSYAPFNLILRFGYDGLDLSDTWLFEHHLRSKFNKRNPFVIIHSQLPGVKYTVSKCDVSRNIKSDGLTIEYEVTCKVYKGFSESVNRTSSPLIFEHDWMFENGLPMNLEPKYSHTSNQFMIWNGSTDTIDPRNPHHDLCIKLNLKTDYGFQLVNYTTGDIFEYKKKVRPNVDFVLRGVHAYYDANKVGIDTNRGVITLAPGKNELKVKGDVSIQQVCFDFPFIYR